MDTRAFRQISGRWLLGAVAAVALSTVASAPVDTAYAATPDVGVVRQAADAQTNVGGGVTVKVSRLEAADAVAFKVVLDTHSVNLDTYDLSQLAVLRTPSGEEIAPIAWESPAGGHHREGMLSFPGATADGAPIIPPDAGPLVLVIRDIAGIAERTFSWPA
jgi:hypothetical protein